MLSFDRAAKIAQAVLYLPNGNPDEQAFSAALSARFPNGSAADKLTHFVTSVGGTCFEGPAKFTTYCGGAPETRPAQCATQVNDALHCTIPVAGTICAVYKLEFQSQLSPTRAISNIVTHGKADTC